MIFSKVNWAGLLQNCATVCKSSPAPMGPEIAQKIDRLPAFETVIPKTEQSFSPPQPLLDNAFGQSLQPLLPFLPWTLRYRTDDPEQEKYGWVELVGPDGVQSAKDFRLGIFWQAPWENYPPHQHNAEELYCIISGEAEWQRGQEHFRPRPAGASFFHSSRQIHSTRTGSEPILALWAWQGQIDWESYSVKPL
ncbi:dimethylsulfonioproprionate lyase family protein [Kiloniella laminariae]|uniref:Dimethylsulfonioproprionate lyase family protein n=1 Tax=Kiloniella laminariae TaxID=454162 RepID=A0ABT4LGC7_9PROT|nr:dimethylsulfonioproprionate lyase family protein [Kiloniella laminariae]MCZ4280157.1 dimethylsulfonioproprionate lyase family protein [Kiloniella laminariae]